MAKKKLLILFCAFFSGFLFIQYLASFSNLQQGNEKPRVCRPSEESCTSSPLFVRTEITLPEYFRHHNASDDIVSPSEPKVIAEVAKSTFSQVEQTWRHLFKMENHDFAKDFSSHWSIPFFDLYMRCPSSQFASGDTEAEALAKSANLGCVTTLTRATDFFQNGTSFLHILNNWIPMFLDEFSYPLVIFLQIDPNLNRTERNQIYAQVAIAANQLLSNYSGSFEYYFLNETGIVAMNTWLGYRMYQDDRLRRFDFIMRMDTDLSILHPIEYDPFVMMALNHRTIGYSMLGMPDVGRSSKRARELFYTFFVKRGILPFGHLTFWGDYGTQDTIVAGPFELFLRSVFDNEEYREFWRFTEIDSFWGPQQQLYGIREQYFKSIWVRLAVAPSAMHWFCDIHFHHKVDFPARCRLNC